MKHYKIKKMVLLAMLAALSYLAVMLIQIPVVAFLKYEPKDVVITIAGFLFGPLAGLLISLTVSLLEMVTFSTTGIIGCIMNFLSTCSFVCVAAAIYKKHRTQWGALIGLAAGSLTMVSVMLLWNWLLTPLYMETTRSEVVQLLLPVFLPFNLLKAGLNSGLTMLIYKPVSVSLRKAKLLPPSPAPAKSSHVWVSLLAAAVAVTCILVILIFQGIL